MTAGAADPRTVYLLHFDRPYPAAKTVQPTPTAAQAAQHRKKELQ